MSAPAIDELATLVDGDLLDALMEALAINSAVWAARTAELLGTASTIALTQWESRACANGTFSTFSIEELAAQVAGAKATRKEALPIFSPAQFGNTRSAAGSLRHSANLVGCTAIVGDHDAGTMTLRDAVNHLRTAGLRGIVYSTPSHRPGKPRWRVVVLLSRPCKRAEYKRLVRRLNAILGGALAIESENAVGFWFYGRVEGQPRPEVHVVADGVAIDEIAPIAFDDDEGSDPVDALSVGGTSPLGLKADPALVAAALAATPNAERSWERWNRTGMMAFAATAGSEAGLAAWLEWSSKHDAHDADACQARWEHFRRSPPGAVGAGTLFREAVQSGWRDPRKDASPDSGGDLSNARILANRMRARFLFDRTARRWRHFDGVRWAADSGEAMQQAKFVADERLRDAARELASAATDEARRRFSQAQQVHRTAGRIEAMLRLAQTEPGLSADGGDFDRDSWLLGAPNGVVDLRTGKLRDGTAGDMLTKIAGFPFDPAARCVRWDRFLADVFDKDAELISFIQRAVGYSLTGSVREEVAFFAHGSGRNGKSILASVLHRIFGDYAVVVGTELLARRRNDSEAARLKLRLRGARLALANELADGDTWDDRALKEIVSREAFSARALYGEATDIVPTHHIWIRANHLPAAHDAGDGFWRRLVLVPFARTFPPGGPEDLEAQMLAEEAPGILAWAVRGCVEWQKSGLRVPTALRAATDRYRTDADILGQWLVSEVARDPANARGVTVADAYASAARFHENAGMSTPSRPAFVRRAVRLGLRAVRSNHVDRYPGFSLKTWPDNDGGDDDAL